MNREKMKILNKIGVDLRTRRADLTAQFNELDATIRHDSHSALHLTVAQMSGPLATHEEIESARVNLNKFHKEFPHLPCGEAIELAKKHQSLRKKLFEPKNLYPSPEDYQFANAIQFAMENWKED